MKVTISEYKIQIGIEIKQAPPIFLSFFPCKRNDVELSKPFGVKIVISIKCKSQNICKIVREPESCTKFIGIIGKVNSN